MKNKFIERGAEVGNQIFNQRSLKKDFRTVIPSIKAALFYVLFPHMKLDILLVISTIRKKLCPL